MSALIGSSNEDYHANRSHLSSSALKLLLKSPEDFYQQYILNIKPPSADKPHFLDGTLLHSLILEPETILTNYAIYPGLRKAGKEYEQFVVQNPGKRIISAPQMARAEKWYQGFTALDVATKLVSGGFAEHTMLGNILGVDVKVRADYINVIDGYIADVKTTASPSDYDAFCASVEAFGYKLSASLYCEVARQAYDKLFDFYFIVVSKADARCEVYKMSPASLTEGASQYTSALILYKKCVASGVWKAEQPRHDISSNTNYEILDI